MNTLAYAILSALARKPCSGYELAEYLGAVWPAKHSQIYPLLTKLEKKEFLEFEHVEQTGRPNKKIFSITEKGKEDLVKWLNESPADPVVRDEFLIKLYSIWMLDEEEAEHIIHKRIHYLEQKMSSVTTKIGKLEQGSDGDGLNRMSKYFGRYILFKRNLRLYHEEIDWCKWTLNLLKKNNFLMWIAFTSKFHRVFLDMVAVA